MKYLLSNFLNMWILTQKKSCRGEKRNLRIRPGCTLLNSGTHVRFQFSAPTIWLRVADKQVVSADRTATKRSVYQCTEEQSALVIGNQNEQIILVKVRVWLILEHYGRSHLKTWDSIPADSAPIVWFRKPACILDIP